MYTDAEAAKQHVKAANGDPTASTTRRNSVNKGTRVTAPIELSDQAILMARYIYTSGAGRGMDVYFIFCGYFSTSSILSFFFRSFVYFLLGFASLFFVFPCPPWLFDFHLHLPVALELYSKNNSRAYRYGTCCPLILSMYNSGLLTVAPIVEVILVL